MKKSLLLSTVLLGGLVLSAQQQAVRLPLEALEKSEIKVLERVETNEKMMAAPAKFVKKEKISGVLQHPTTQAVYRALTPKNTLHLKAASASEMLNGTMYLRGHNWMNGEGVAWETDVTLGENNIYTFENVLGFIDVPVTATLSGNTLTFVDSIGEFNLQGIPVTLEMIKIEMEETEQGYVPNYVDEPVTATVDPAAETISFSGIYALSIRELREASMLTDALMSIYGDVIIYTANSFPLEDLGFLKPEGALYYGYATDAQSMYVWPDLILATPSSVPFTWLNTSVQPVATWEWNYSKLENYMMENESSVPATAVTTTDLEMTGLQFGDVYTYPVLTATAGEESRDVTYEFLEVPDERYEIYPLQGREPRAVFQVGALPYQLAENVYINLTNFNIDAGLAWNGANGGNMYGTATVDGKTMETVYSYFEAPHDALSFMGVQVRAANFETLPANALTMYVIETSISEQGNLVFGDTLAQSSSCEEAGTQLLMFYDFVAKDEDGITSTLDEVAIKNPENGFVLALTGFNVEGADFAVFSEVMPRPDGMSYSYFTLKNADGTLDDGLYSWVGNTSTMYMELYGAILGNPEQSGIAPVETNNTTKLFSTSDAFNFTYTDDFTSVDVYNVNGQKVSTYALPQTGTFSIAKAGLADGVYMFRMNGKTTEVLRAVK